MIDQFKLIYYYYGCVRVCVGMQGCAWVCTGIRSVGGCAQAFVKVCGCLRVCAWDEFSEYLLKNRAPTSADFNTYPIRIFLVKHVSKDCSAAHTCAHSPTPAYPHLLTPAHTRAYPHTLAHTHTHTRPHPWPAHTRAHPTLPTHTH